jgi:MFS family permease
VATAALGTLVALYVARIDAPPSAAAWAAASYSLGFLLGCFYIFRPLARIGHIRAFAAAAGLCSIATLTLYAEPGLAVLLAARFLTGVATAALYAIGDAWINDCAPPRARGRVLAIYSIILGIAAVASQGLVMWLAEDLASAFVAIAVLYSVAIVLLAPTRSTPPPVAGILSLRFRAAFREAPTAVVGCFVNGFVIALLLNVVPYELSVAGLGATLIAVLVGTLYAGRITLQFPLGTLSDRRDRRVVILWVTLATAALLAALAFVSRGDASILTGARGVQGQVVMLAGAFLLGGCILPLYSLLIAHAIDRTVPVYVGPTAVTLLFVFTIGSVIGPIAGGALASAFGGVSIVWASAALTALAGLYTAWRLLRAERAPAAEAAANVMAASTSVAVAPTEKRPPMARLAEATAE